MDTFTSFLQQGLTFLVVALLMFQPILAPGAHPLLRGVRPSAGHTASVARADQPGVPKANVVRVDYKEISPPHTLQHSPRFSHLYSTPTPVASGNPGLEMQIVTHSEVMTPLSGRVPISITETGFDPQAVTITVGTIVEWTNRTHQTVHIQSGEPYHIYLPLVLRNVGGASPQATQTLSGSRGEVQLTSGPVFSGTITPGGIFMHAFTTEGTFPYFLIENPALTGLINVEPIPFDFLLGVHPALRTVPQGQSVTYTVAVTGTLGQPSPVTLAVGGLPDGAIWELDPATVVPTATAVLSLTTALTTPVGNHTLVITGTGEGQMHTASATLSVTPHPDFILEVWPSVREVIQGQSVTYTVVLTSLYGFSAPVILGVEDLPADTVADWSLNPATPDASTVLTITTGSHAPTGTHLLTVWATGGGFTHTAAFTLSISPHAGFILDVTPETRSVPQGEPAVYEATVTGLYDFAEPVTLTVSGMPTGVDAAILPNPVVPTGTAAITLTTALTTPTGDHLLTLTGTGGGRVHTIPFTLTVTPHPDFALEITPDTLNVRQSRLITATVIVTELHGFQAPVMLNVEGLPENLGVIWASNPVTPNSTTLVTFTTSLTTPQGSYSLVLTGSGGGFTHSFPFTMTVLPHPDFIFAVVPPAQAITQGMAITYTAYITGQNDWEGPIWLGIEGLPADAEASWNPPSLIPDGTSVLVITPALTTPPGLYSLIGWADGDIISHTVPITLEVLKIPEPDLVIEQIASEPLTPTADFPFTITVRVRNQGNLAITQTFQVDWYADPATPPLTTTPGTGYWLVEGLGVGEAAVLMATHTFTLTGQHVLWAQADRTQAVPESDEANNLTGPVTMTAGLPDLWVPAVIITPSIPQAGNSFTVAVMVENRGIADAVGSFQVDWYDGEETPPPPTIPGTVS